MEKGDKLKSIRMAVLEEQDAWDNRDMSELARKPKLDRNDWTDITGFDPDKPVGSDEPDRLGMYLITDEAISFCGWDEDFIRSQPVRLRSDMRRQNNHRLTFPCTPRELVEFVDADVHFSGCLYDSLPDGFRKAVATSYESYDIQSDASLGAAVRQQRKNFAERQRESQEEREREFQRWREEGAAIQKERSRKASKRHLAELIKASLNLPDSTETIRKRL